jgi:hypothetical protein
MSSAPLRLPAPPAAAPAPGAFALLPAALLPAVSEGEEARRRALYEWALAEARAVVRPSLPERDLAGVWN